MGKESSSGGFNGWGTAGIAALLVVGGFFARNYFNSPSVSITGDGNQAAGRDINTNNTNVYGSSDSLLVVPSNSATVTAAPQAVEAKAPASEYALQVLAPPILINPVAGTLPDGRQVLNAIIVPPGQEYKLEFTINYRSQTPTKFYANIVPDSRVNELHAKAHLDNVSVTGRPLEGDGTLRFSLRGTAPMEPGMYNRSVTLGLMDYNNWATQGSIVHYEYPFNITVVN